MAGQARFHRLRRFNRGAFDRGVGRARGRDRSRAQIGQIQQRRRVRVIPGHSLTLASLGVFILFQEWLGFNPDRRLLRQRSGISHRREYPAAGCLGRQRGPLHFLVEIRQGRHRHDLERLSRRPRGHHCSLCNSDAALVPSSSEFSPGHWVVSAFLFFDKIKVDDPVGAISVHGVLRQLWHYFSGSSMRICFLGLPYDFAGQLFTQAIGVVTAFAWTFGICSSCSKSSQQRSDCA